MYLKKVELFGFKSFADKTEVVFEPGVTCVVGPNGCGKSNISDAIRWVLGERRVKLLRGSKMEDVIFSGTDSRKPVNFAEVSLTIDNTDQKLPIQYEEVVISRRLHRSGESEYMLNRTPCRLRDIYDLILDTGIGSNSYSMIEQGRIDYILNAHAEERRSLIEEAAGISKYKAKKEEALRKLERTEQNLLRINDIVSEVGRNIRYAERQAKRAEKFKAQIHRLKYLETRRAFARIKTEDAALAELATQKPVHEQTIDNLQEKTEDLKRALRNQDDALRELDQTFFDEETKRSEAKQNLASLDNREQFTRDKIESLKLASEKDLGEIEAIAQNLNRINAELKQSGKHVDRAEFEAQQATVFALAREISDVRNTLNETVIALARLSHAESTSKERLAKLSEQKEDLQTRRRGLIENRQTHESSQSQASRQLTELHSALQTAKTARDTATQQEETLKETKTRLQNQKMVLDELSLQDNGDPKQIVKEYAQSGHNKNIQALLDVVEIESGYEVAVEAVLSSAIKAVIAEDMDAAVNLLNQIQNKGNMPTTIMIRDRAVPNGNLRRHENVEAHPAVKKRLWGVIRVKDGYEELLGNLLGDVYIVDAISPGNAAELASLTEHTRLVTQSGAVLGPQFQISLKSRLNTPEQSPVAREKKQKSLQNELENLSHELISASEVKTKSQETLDELQIKHSELADNLHDFRAILERTDGVEVEIESHWKGIHDEISLIDEESTQARKDVARHEVNQREQTAALAQLEEKQSKAQSLLQQMQDEKSLLLLAEQRDDLTARRNTLEEERTVAANQIESFAAELAGFQVEKKVCDESLLSRSVAVEQVKQKRIDVTGDRNTLLEKLQEIAKSIEEEKQGLHNISIQEVEHRHQKDSVAKELEDRYKIRISGLDATSYDAGSEEIAQEIQELEELRKKVEASGAVNLMAIDEYDDLKQRFDFLDTQREDLVKARESLLDAVRQINRTTKKLFDETLQKVRASFREYFRALFAGGHADLVLLDEAHPLDSGLDIVARPPGKKLQHISLLSGGEKALTAIALLLSLFSVRPSPFCVLDEVDAPLDEANNERFITALKPFLKTTQFVMITHSRKTIGMANALYGVTMQEPGVSTMVSVRLGHKGESVRHEDENVEKEINQVLN